MILVLADYYLPGFKAGGPIRTLSSLVDRLGAEFAFWILTRDRDFGDVQPYPQVRPGQWVRVGRARVQYMCNSMVSFAVLKDALQASGARALYMNSFFSLRFSILPMLYRRIGLIPGIPVIIAPRGEFSPGALRLKRLKKRLYITASRMAGLYHGVIWQASSEHEAQDIRREHGLHARVIVAPDLATASGQGERTARAVKHAGALRVVFLSRISRKKNLDGALQLLSRLDGRISFDIYGPIEDDAYWKQCVQAMQGLPANVTAKYAGPLMPAEVASVFRDHDVFLFPTLGENFGHVILEALAAGCPVVVSDQTPWRGLDKAGVGWDLPLDRPELFERALAACMAMEDREFRRMSARAVRYAMDHLNDPTVLERNRKLFCEAVARAG